MFRITSVKSIVKTFCRKQDIKVCTSKLFPTINVHHFGKNDFKGLRNSKSLVHDYLRDNKPVQFYLLLLGKVPEGTGLKVGRHLQDLLKDPS